MQVLSQKIIETFVETPIWSSAVLRLLDRKHENLVGFVMGFSMHIDFVQAGLFWQRTFYTNYVQ